ncbi:ABC transporter permease [Microbacterium terricola]|uniref:Sugar ABC transporter permease n=1 Tax=Microbacterium terricola TaxID=344163 RepID=A0ABM8DWD9_9MICO|nr:ABC transporter permease [Microbacterium terricola]UYK39377.1 ABC transporter permease [Microbacterium terricola]BDV29899.1 sugar ABC transporter permease [Microbacterium terricola]
MSAPARIGPAPLETGRATPRRRHSTLLADFGPLSALVLLCIVFSVLSPQFRTWGNLRNVLDSAAVLAVIAVGLTFVLLLGAIDLSIEGVMATAAISTALLVANTRNDIDLGFLGIVAAVALGACFGLASGLLSTGLKIPSFMTTLGISAIGIGVATVLFAGVQPTVTDPVVAEWASGQWFGLTRLTFVAVAVIVIGLLIQRYTRLGRYARAIGGAEELAVLSGMPVRRYKTLAFTFAGAVYGLAGVMVTVQLGSGIVQAGVGLNFAAITAAVVGGTLLSGGRGGVLQSVVGVLIVTVLANGLVLIGVSPYVQRAVQGVIVVVAVVITAWPLRERLRVVK